MYHFTLLSIKFQLRDGQWPAVLPKPLQRWPHFLVGHSPSRSSNATQWDNTASGYHHLQTLKLGSFVFKKGRKAWNWLRFNWPLPMGQAVQSGSAQKHYISWCHAFLKSYWARLCMNSITQTHAGLTRQRSFAPRTNKTSSVESVAGCGGD